MKLASWKMTFCSSGRFWSMSQAYISDVEKYTCLCCTFTGCFYYKTVLRNMQQQWKGGSSTFQSFEKPIRCQINVKLLPEMRISRICCNQKIFSVMQHRNVELQKKINIYIYLVQIAVQADTYRCASMSLVSCCWCTFHVSPSLSSHKHLLLTPSPFWALPLALFYNLMFGCSDIWT